VPAEDRSVAAGFKLAGDRGARSAALQGFHAKARSTAAAV